MEDEFEVAREPRQVPEGHIGTELRAQRLELGRELSEIAQQTRVPLRHLTAIENGDHSTLPALPYTVGFVKSYARAVGMDPDAAAGRFREETTMTVREPSPVLMTPIDERRTPPKSAMLLGTILVLLFAAAIILFTSGVFDSDPEAGEEVLEAVVPADPVLENAGAPLSPEESEQAFEVEEGALTAAEPAADAPIVIRAVEDAWIRVSSQAGETIMQRVLSAGETYEVPAGRDDLLLRTGKASALRIVVGTRELPLLSDGSDVVGNVRLTPEGLEAATAAAEEG